MNLDELINEKNRLVLDNQVSGKEEEYSEGDIVQLVTFLLTDVEYGLDILQVHEIIRYPDMTRLPNTPPFIKGVINLRGSVIPVLDIRERFGFQRVKETESTRVIVIEANEKLFGLLVDNVHQVVRLPISHIDPPSRLIEGISEVFIKGIGRAGGRLIVILNLESMLFEQEGRASEQ